MSVTTSDIPSFSGTLTGRFAPVFSGVTMTRRVAIPISGPNFLYRLEAEIVSEELLGDKFVARFNVDENVDFILTIVSNQIEQGATVESGQFSLNYQISEPRARAHFVVSTLMATFGLAGGMQLMIPELQIDQRLNIVVPPLEISRLLQSRQMAFRLMVIEKATGVEFVLPQSIPIKDKDNLTFVYRAIVDRSFTWHSGKGEASIPAQKERLSGLPSTEEPFPFPQGINPFSQIVLDRVINLGLTQVTIEDAIIRNLQAVRQELETDDGHKVKVGIESLTGQVSYNFPEAPRLAKMPWDQKIRGLIDLDSELDSALLIRYNELAASTLEGLSEEQKAIVTARPELDEEAFSL